MDQLSKHRRTWGNRKDARYVKDVTGLQVIMSHVLANRTDCEVFFQDTFDATEVVKYLEQKNASHEDYKTTIFHCIVTGLARMIKERPLMNRFVQGRRFYERYDISLSFVAKRRFKDGADEAMMFLVAKDDDTLDSISKRIYGDVHEVRKSEHSTGGIDSVMDTLAKLPRPILMFVLWIIKCLDFWGINPNFLTDGDPNYSTILCSNLGSISCPSVYHHLNNYGTNSIMVTIGTLRKEEVLMPDGTRRVRDLIDIGATLDERIADGFYFARSLKLIRHIFAHPELLDRPIGEPSGFDYK